jgi:hypothetical protein
MMNGKASPMLFNLVVATTLLGCSSGHSDYPPGTGELTIVGSGGDSGTSGVTAVCPAAIPASGSCSTPGLQCESGNDQDLTCDGYIVCTEDPYESNSLKWSIVPGLVSPPCPTSGAGIGGCPSTYAEVISGQACSDNGLECGYPQGRCACTTPVSLAPVSDGPSWVCEQPGTGCPEPRPRLGTSCETPRQQCDYGSCTLPNGTALICQSGSWATLQTACPE